MNSRLNISVLAALVVILAVSGGAFAEGLRFEGLAYDAGTGEFLYREVHQASISGETIAMDTQYLLQNQSPIAHRVVRYEADPLAPSFELRDQRLDRTEGARREGDQIEVYVTSASDSESAIVSPGKRPVVIDAGFDRLIAVAWDRLKGGETVYFDFLSTARLGLVGFRVQFKGTRQVDGESVSDFEMTAANFFVRILLPPIQVSYYDADRALHQYEGISNIRDERGQNFDVVIKFPRSLRTGDAGLFAVNPADSPVVSGQ